MADVGKILIIPRGTYSATDTYNILDVVRYNNGTYMSKKDNLTGVTPVDGSDWMLLVEDGSSGTTTLNGLTDVDVSSAINGQYLKYVNDGTNPPYWTSSNVAAALSELTDVDFSTPPTNGQILKYVVDTSTTPPTGYWTASTGGGGGSDYTMLPDPAIDPASLVPPKTVEQNAVDAIEGGVLEGYSNDDVASLNTIGWWSNTMTKKYFVQGIAGSSTPIGKSGIGNWCVDGSDETGWISIPELVGIGSKDHTINITYDPSKSGIIIRGGYVIDDTTGKMCIKFANEISEADTHTAKIGIEVTINRTESNPVSF